MRTLYIDCGMGAAGDMLTAALLELMPNADEFIEGLYGEDRNKPTEQDNVLKATASGMVQDTGRKQFFYVNGFINFFK